MSRFAQVTRTGTLIILLVSASSSSAQQVTQRAPGTDTTASTQPSAGRPRLLKAFVIDDRLSALRREPGVQSQVVRRLRR